MAEALSLSRPTIARATAALVESGVLKRGPGRSGTYVATKARALSRSAAAPKIRTIGLIMQGAALAESGPVGGAPSPSPYDVGFLRVNISGDIVQGVLSVIRSAGCRLLVHHNDTSDEEREIIANLAAEHIDGAIVMPWQSRPSWPAAVADTDLPPIVFVDRYIPNMHADWVATDNFACTKRAISELIASGHRRIAFLTDYAPITSVMDREAGYRAALADAGIEVDEDLICGPTVTGVDVCAFTHGLFFCTRRPDPVTAAFGINDDIVWSALRSAEKLGLRVPDDIEIAGFFDTPVPHGKTVPFTRLVQRTHEMGRVAAQLLLDRIDNKLADTPQHVLIEADIVPGGHSASA